MAKILILFDADCPLCEQLAALAAHRAGPHLGFCSWQNFRQSPEAQAVLASPPENHQPSELGALHNGHLLEGTAAWDLLLTQHPDLQSLNWLAQRLGLQKTTSQALRGAGALLRALCPRCPRRTPPTFRKNR